MKDTHLPPLRSLDKGLLETSARYKIWLLIRPLIGLMGYILVIRSGYLYLIPIPLFYLFIADVSVTHDMVHHSLHLSKKQREVALFLMGIILLSSGHSFRITHRQHHLKFPSHDGDDPESIPAYLLWWQSLLYGFVYQPRLWYWAYHKTNDRVQKKWIMLELFIIVMLPLFGLLIYQITPFLLLYTLLIYGATMLYPFLTVYLPHHGHGDTELTQSRSLRGPFISWLLMQQSYHLEHHLYPAIPSHQLPKIARLLEWQDKREP